MIEITLILDNKNSKPMYIQLANHIKQEILCGRIKPKEKLPSKRNLANHLGLSINTIQSAYEQLSAEGYVESKPRKGLFVTNVNHDLKINQNKSSEKVDSKTKIIQEKPMIDFNSGKVDLQMFPYSKWRKLTLESLYEDKGKLFYMGNPQGELYLREQIAAHLYASRGVRCSPEQIVIGAGTQVLLGLLCLIIGKEHTYALENPGFHRTRITLQDLGVRTVPVTLDEDGLDIRHLKKTDANVVYVTPSHQFPKWNNNACLPKNGTVKMGRRKE